MKQLRPHQERAIAMLRSSLASGKRRPLLQLPTGAGKTVIAATIAEGAQRKSNKLVFCVPAISLIDQTVQAFWEDGIRDVGVIQANHPMTDWSKPIQIASIQTLERRVWPKASVVIVDEAHRWFQSYGRWMRDEDWQNVPFIGLTATPWTKGLGRHYDDLLIASTTAELIRDGYLSPFRVFAPSHPDLSGVKIVAGDYHEGQLSDVMQEGRLTADIVTTWLQRGEDRPTLCFAVDRAHAKKLQRQFEQAGVPTAYIDAFTDMEERETIRRRFHAGSVKVVCNVGCLTTGVDWDVRCIVLARPTRSEMLFVQIVGRGLRTADGKQDCLVLDHSDTHLRLGFVTDIHHETLDTGEKRAAEARERAEPLPKECPKCSYLKPARVGVCPSCGFKPERQSEIKCEAGELVELQSKAQRKHNRDDNVEFKRSFYAGLLWYCQSKGWKSGMASRMYRERYGVWPNDPRTRSAYPEPPNEATKSWIKARNIRFHKRKAA